MIAPNSIPAYKLSDIFDGEDLELLYEHNVKTTRAALKIEALVELPVHIRGVLRCFLLPRIGVNLLLALKDVECADPLELSKARPEDLQNALRAGERLTRTPHILALRDLVKLPKSWSTNEYW